MEFWKKTRKKKTMTLGTLEKTMKKKIISLRFRPGRRKPKPWSFQKNQEKKDHNYGVFEKTKKKTTPRLWELWKKP
jgi:hypothetical protein